VRNAAGGGARPGSLGDQLLRGGQRGPTSGNDAGARGQPRQPAGSARPGEPVPRRTALPRARSAFRAARTLQRGLRLRRHLRRRRSKAEEKLREKLRKRRRRIVVLLVVAFALAVLGMIAMLFFVWADQSNDAATSLAAQEQGMGVGGVCTGMDPVEVQRRTGGLGTSADQPTAIPPEAFAAYCSAATAYQVDWALLAAVGWRECKNGQAQAAGCNPRGSVNRAGARGPMQVLGSTWDSSQGTFDPDVRTRPIPKGDEYLGFATDGDGDGWADPWDWADAAHAAARQLAHYQQSLGDWGRAVEGYNAGPGSSAPGYREAVERIAGEYRRVTADIVGHPGVPVGGGRKAQTADGAPVTVVAMTDLAGQPLHDGRGRPVEVNMTIAPRVQALFHAAEQELDGDLTVVSSFRDAQTQIELYEGCKAQYGGTCPGTVAEPGTSMHEQGRAIDFGCASTGFMDETTPCFRWLEQNAARFGLQVLQWRRGGELVEPWHWSDNGS
jgi:D-alanyl-D-alanine carboxypeptidase-like protein